MITTECMIVDAKVEGGAAPANPMAGMGGMGGMGGMMWDSWILIPQYKNNLKKSL